MKLILLRHEERGQHPGFFTSLTNRGLLNSNNLINKIDEHQPDIIYSSPFLRTIQTIRPYALKKNKKIRIDYSLYEYIHASEFNLKNYKHQVTELDENIYKDIMDDYKSILQPDNIKCKENENDITSRVYNFLNILKEKHKNQTILIVSHMSTLNIIRKYYNNQITLDSNLPMGSLTILI
tara:strand:- start:106 stop:645 length:540 start_codon:yes stop_codon:yes gene_type:complete